MLMMAQSLHQSHQFSLQTKNKSARASVTLFSLLWCACTAVCVLLIASVGTRLITVAQARAHADAIALAVVLGDELSAQSLAQLVDAKIISVNRDGQQVSVVIEFDGVHIQARATR